MDYIKVSPVRNTFIALFIHFKTAVQSENYGSHKCLTGSEATDRVFYNIRHICFSAKWPGNINGKEFKEVIILGGACFWVCCAAHYYTAKIVFLIQK